jgi:hypothetical protein
VFTVNTNPFRRRDNNDDGTTPTVCVCVFARLDDSWYYPMCVCFCHGGSREESGFGIEPTIAGCVLCARATRQSRLAGWLAGWLAGSVEPQNALSSPVITHHTHTHTHTPDSFVGGAWLYQPVRGWCTMYNGCPTFKSLHIWRCRALVGTVAWACARVVGYQVCRWTTVWYAGRRSFLVLAL